MNKNLKNLKDLKDLKDFIERVEKDHFRTEHDTGANSCAMLIWNMVRQHAGLPRISRADLPAWNGIKNEYEMPKESKLLTNTTNTTNTTIPVDIHPTE